METTIIILLCIIKKRGVASKVKFIEDYYISLPKLLQPI
jgi:hypothetical protein